MTTGLNVGFYGINRGSEYLLIKTEGVSICGGTRVGDFDVFLFPSEKWGHDRLSFGMIKFQTSFGDWIRWNFHWKVACILGLKKDPKSTSWSFAFIDWEEYFANSLIKWKKKKKGYFENSFPSLLPRLISNHSYLIVYASLREEWADLGVNMWLNEKYFVRKVHKWWMSLSI